MIYFGDSCNLGRGNQDVRKVPRALVRRNWIGMFPDEYMCAERFNIFQLFRRMGVKNSCRYRKSWGGDGDVVVSCEDEVEI